jgi:hypothetical protein
MIAGILLLLAATFFALYTAAAVLLTGVID